MEQVIHAKYSTKIEGDTKLNESMGNEVLREFARKMYRFSPFFKVKKVEVQYYEYYQSGHMDIDLVWRFWFSRFFFKLLGGHIRDE